MNECACKKCVGACRTTPGWFRPEQIPDLLEFLGKPLEEMFGVELAWQWGPDDENPVFALAPNLMNNRNELYPYDPNGTCIFFIEPIQRCAIHAVKPFECAEYHHDDNRVAGIFEKRRAGITDAWRDQQDMVPNIEELREGVAEFVRNPPRSYSLYSNDWRWG